MIVSDVVTSLASLANKVAEPQKKSQNYKFTLQIGSDVFIPVRKVLANREEKPSWDKYKKEREHIDRRAVAARQQSQPPPAIQQQSQPPADIQQQSQPPAANQQQLQPSNAANDTSFPTDELMPSVPVVSTKPLHIAKEVKYISSKGDEVAEQELQKGYIYGGEIVREEGGIKCNPYHFLVMPSGMNGITVCFYLS